MREKGFSSLSHSPERSVKSYNSLLVRPRHSKSTLDAWQLRDINCIHFLEYAQNKREFNIGCPVLFSLLLFPSLLSFSSWRFEVFLFLFWDGCASHCSPSFDISSGVRGYQAEVWSWDILTSLSKRADLCTRGAVRTIPNARLLLMCPLSEHLISQWMNI